MYASSSRELSRDGKVDPQVSDRTFPAIQLRFSETVNFRDHDYARFRHQVTRIDRGGGGIAAGDGWGHLSSRPNEICL